LHLNTDPVVWMALEVQLRLEMAGYLTHLVPHQYDLEIMVGIPKPTYLRTPDPCCIAGAKSIGIEKAEAAAGMDCLRFGNCLY
jgi:hypothetical protein